MAATKQKSVERNPLAAAAMLVCIDVHQWGNRKVENELAEKTAEDNRADKEMFFTTKKLVDRATLKVVSSAFSRFKAFHYENTLPWLNNGYRILPAANYLAYTENSRKLKEDALQSVEDFLKIYPTVRDAAAKRLGDAFDEEDYPTPDQLRRKWGINTHFFPVPDKADFRTDIPAAELKRIAASIDDQVAIGLKHATQDLFERLYQVVLVLRDKLKAYKVSDEGGKRKTENVFRDSAVDNIRELCDLLPRLNFTHDENLDHLAAEVMKSLGSQDAEQLRENEQQRLKVTLAADAVLAKMADYIGDGVA